MRHAGISFICIFGLLAGAASGQQSRPDFSGKWQLNAEKSKLHSGKASCVNVTIEQKGASIHVVKTLKDGNGKESVEEFTCTTDGKDCNAKSAKVSLWYDGGSLVELDVADGLVSKSSMTIGDGAKTISITVSYISPQAEADDLVLEKM
jgi:hypothetical protein